MRFPIVLSTFCVVVMLFTQAVANPIYDLQKILVLQGYDIGKIDGIIGRNTISKLKQFCSSNSLNCENLIADKKYDEILNLISSAESVDIATIPTKSQRLKSGQLAFDDSNGAWFDRSLKVRGVEIVVAGAVGGQLAVPNIWVEKVAQTFKLLTTPNAKNINKKSYDRMIQTLYGKPGTWHAGYPTGQRIAYGGGDDYKPNPLRETHKYKGFDDWNDRTASDDMVWYKNSSHGYRVNTKGDDDINEVLEHVMHTLHLFGVRGAVEGSVENLNWENETREFQNGELWLAMDEAIKNGIFNVRDYHDGNPKGKAAHIMMKEYMYLLNFSMWSFGKEFWSDGGSLEPEWANRARSPEGVLKHNPLGHALFMQYFNPVLSKPSTKTLRSMFKDNDQGVSGYIP